jgi:PhzF family phenazine biosynthesis protein
MRIKPMLLPINTLKVIWQAICLQEKWLPEKTMQAVAAEDNLSETVFFVPEGDGFPLRGFTPTTEVDLCGHATLAAALPLRIFSFATFKCVSMLAGISIGSFKLGLGEVLNPDWCLIRTVFSSSLAELDSFA